MASLMDMTLTTIYDEEKSTERFIQKQCCMIVFVCEGSVKVTLERAGTSRTNTCLQSSFTTTSGVLAERTGTGQVASSSWLFTQPPVNGAFITLLQTHKLIMMWFITCFLLSLTHTEEITQHYIQCVVFRIQIKAKTIRQDVSF